jgi:hypothetical protein
MLWNDPTRTSAALGNGQQAVKSLRYLLTDPRQFDIVQSGLGWPGSDAIRSIKTKRGHHLSRRRSSDNLDISHFCLLWFWNDDSIFKQDIRHTLNVIKQEAIG